METTEVTNTYKLPKTVLGIIALGILTAIIGIYAYYDQFGRDNFWQFGGRESFGQFGDYLGGLLNPILTFFTVALLIWSIQIQMRELHKSTLILDETKKAHQEQLRLSKDESIRKQLEDNSSMHLNNCEKLLDKPMFTVPNRLKPGLLISVNDMFKNPEYIDDFKVDAIQNRIPLMLESDVGLETRHLHEIRAELSFSVSMICHLITYLRLVELQQYWENRVRILILDCKNIQIITELESEEWLLALTGAKNIANNAN